MNPTLPGRPELASLPSTAPAGRGKDLGRTITQSVQTAAIDQRSCELLVRLDSSNAGEVFSIDSRSFTIGRDPKSSACLDDRGLSRQHLRITRIGDRHIVEDLGSSNGTFVNAERIVAHQLEHGDVIQLGPRVCFRYTVASKGEERVLRQLYEASVRDAMTRAYNRPYFLGQLHRELSFAQRHRSELSLLLFDVDHFKRINDTYGHLGGDAVLESIAGVVLDRLRKEDVFARYGGEEFVVLLRDVPLQGAATAAERLRSAVEQSAAQFGDQTISATISLGCASMACCANATADALVQRADGRLYQAKRDGRNRCVWQD